MLFAFRKSIANRLAIETGKTPKNDKKRLFSSISEASVFSFVSFCNPLVYSVFRVVHSTGVEPITSAFGGQRSIQLSYECFSKVILNYL